MNFRHGHARQFGSRTYHVWIGMRQRCGNPSNSAYPRYGGRGIKVCERWKVFENFLVDMGEAPEGLTLDRYPNNNGDYELSNCRWATRREQSLNRRPVSEEGRKNIALSQIGKRASLKTRLKMSISAKRAWAARG